MNKTLAFALALSATFLGQTTFVAPQLFAQGVVKKAKDKVVGAAEATGDAAKKVGNKTKEVATDAASATADGAKKVVSKTKERCQKAGSQSGRARFLAKSVWAKAARR